MRKRLLTLALLLAVTAACGAQPTATPVEPTTAPAQPTATPIPATAAPEHGWLLPADKYLFIDHHIHVAGECVEGECDPGPMVDFPTYDLDPETGVLQSWVAFEVKEGLMVVYGDGVSLSGAAGGGAATGLTGVYTLPAQLDNLRIVQVDLDGTAHLEYGGRSLALVPGQEWLETTEETQTQEGGQLKLTTADRFYNYGILDKAKMALPAPAPTPTAGYDTMLTSVVADILAAPEKYLEQKVTIVGYFRGWDLFGEAGTGPPVSRSDWVVKDNSGAIYVKAGNKVADLDPSSPEDTSWIVWVTGLVRLTPEGQPYIESTKVDLMW